MCKSVILFILILTSFNVNLSAGNAKPEKIKLYPVKVNGKWGFINNSGKIIVQARFDDVDKSSGFSEGMIGVKENKKWGFMNDKGEVVIAPQFDAVHYFRNGMAGFDVKTDDGWGFGGKRGFINKSGKIIVPPDYDAPFMSQGDFSDDVCLVEKDHKYGYIDKNGHEIIKPQYSWGTAFDNGVASVQHIEGTDTNYAIINKDGKIIADGFKSLSNFSNGCASGTKNGINGIVKKDGTFISLNGGRIELFFYLSCDNGILNVGKSDKYGLVKTNGDPVSDIKYDAINNFSEGYVGTNLGGKQSGKGWLKTIDGGWGFLDEKGQVAIAMNFDKVTYFSDGLAAAKKDGKWGYINTKGEWIINPVYDDTPGAFKDGIAKIEIKMGEHYDSPVKIGYIDKKGKYIWNPQM